MAGQQPKSDDFANDNFFPDLGNLFLNGMGDNINVGGPAPAAPYWRESHDAGDGIVDAVLTVAVTDEAVVADDSRGEATCLMTTFGSGLRIRRSCSFTSSAARASTFSAFVLSDSLRPRKSTDSTFRCESIAPAAAPAVCVWGELSALLACRRT
uniref:Uncharacterized protein n=1 Tax=Aegilops tauschii TaxID=37682 RepID=M8C311_AEGTA